ncbi:MAG TPA: TolC family outer membrane protein [Acetobacteraceae bacterium]|nr:TolC family outer membrane protein [Acetobacteraceae bacterium]
MRLRPTLLIGLSLLAAAPVLAQPRKPQRANTNAASSGAAASQLVAAPNNTPRTLAQALVATYAYNPALLEERARLRTVDEGVPQALSGWRPTVVLSGNVGYADGVSRERVAGQGIKTPAARDIGTAQALLTQPLYTGGRVDASVQRAKNAVFAERAALIGQEETSFSDTVSAYVGVIQARQILEIQRNNEQVLAQQLQATQDRFRVGEITQTDVAQAQAALASARATLLTAQGSLRTAEAAYIRAVGSAPPPDLELPQPLKLPVRNGQEAAAMAGENNPTVIAALFNLAAARDAVDVAFANLLPQLSLQGQAFHQSNQLIRGLDANGYQVTANLSVPLYQGGAEYSAVRAAKQTATQQERAVADARRTAVQNAVQAWQTLEAALAAADSSRAAVAANEIAVQGEQRQALVGTATTLDVLVQTQTLLNARLTLVQNLANIVTASYAVASAIGRLTARDLGLPVVFYDDTAYYNAVKNKWFGLSGPPLSQLYHTASTSERARGGIGR